MLEKNDIKIFDNLLTPFQEDYFAAMIFGKTSQDKKQEVQPSVDFTVKYELTAQEENHVPLSFTHILKSSPKLSPHLETFSYIPIAVCEHLKMFLKDIYFARIFLTMPYKTQLEYANPHTDLVMPHWVVLYYVNDADGDTVFFDKNKNIIERVTPKKGRIVFFKGNIMHGGGIPKEYPRAVVNFDIAI